ncbi:MAG: sigma-70 family RNA polymerase sigma factor [Byssovorax sp.]
MSVDVAAPFREHERLLRGLCYRLTGSAADADDLVQETFLRAMERPPARTSEPWKPWLVRVAVNLGRDALRRRRRTAYVGPWLPSPIEAEAEAEEPLPSFEIAGEGTTEGRYDLLESVSFAFLLALEALTPQQRAVLLLRDVFDYSVEETAAALGLSASNVKTTHHRARRALLPYEQSRCRPTPDLVARSAGALQRFLTSLMSDDVAAVEAQLAEGVVALNDGGGQFFAARRPVVGAANVAKLNVGIKRMGPGVSRWEIRILNGLPALVAERDGTTVKEAPRFVLRVDIDAAGRITALHTILATRKLTAVRAIGASGSPA